MKKKFYLINVLLCSTLFLTSCWDQELLKESKLVYGAGFDYEGDRGHTHNVCRSQPRCSR